MEGRLSSSLLLSRPGHMWRDLNSLAVHSVLLELRSVVQSCFFHQFKIHKTIADQYRLCLRIGFMMTRYKIQKAMTNIYLQKPEAQRPLLQFITVQRNVANQNSIGYMTNSALDAESLLPICYMEPFIGTISHIAFLTCQQQMPGQQVSCVLQLTGTAATRREIYPQSPGGCMLPNKILAIFPIYLSIFLEGGFLRPIQCKTMVENSFIFV